MVPSVLLTAKPHRQGQKRAIDCHVQSPSALVGCYHEGEGFLSKERKRAVWLLQRRLANSFDYSLSSATRASCGVQSREG